MAHTRLILEETNDWSGVLRARAMVIKSHDYPLAWLTRVPDCDEVSTLLSYIVESGATTVSYADGRPDTTDTAMCIHDAACFLLDAIDASDERREGLSFQEAFPARRGHPTSHLLQNQQDNSEDRASSKLNPTKQKG